MNAWKLCCAITKQNIKARLFQSTFFFQSFDCYLKDKGQTIGTYGLRQGDGRSKKST